MVCRAVPSYAYNTQGLGGQYAYGGNIPFFGIEIPCIAGAAIFGIIMNLILNIGKRK